MDDEYVYCSGDLSKPARIGGRRNLGNARKKTKSFGILRIKARRSKWSRSKVSLGPHQSVEMYTDGMAIVAFFTRFHFLTVIQYKQPWGFVQTIDQNIRIALVFG